MSYTDPTGMTEAEMHQELEQAYLDHYESTDHTKHPEYCGESFEEMVRMFAEDDFYKDHLLAKAYLLSPYAFEPLNPAVQGGP